VARHDPSRAQSERQAAGHRHDPCLQEQLDGYLIPEFGDTPVRHIDKERIRVMTDRLDMIPSPLNPRSKFNGITRPVLIVLM